MIDYPTLANWRTPRFSRTSFQRVREVIPTAAIACPAPQPLPRAAVASGLSALPVPAPGGGETRWGDLIASNHTDACIALKDGEVVWEWRAPHFDAALPHILFSVTKSVTGTLTGCLVAEGPLDPSDAVTRHLPELAGSVFEGATLRNLLDMTLASSFEEVYDDPQADYVRYRVATGWNPPRSDCPGDLLSFLPGMPRAQEAHGRTFRYLSPVTDTLGLVLERASGKRWSTLLSEHIWGPMGATGPADMTLDPAGAPRGAGGLSATLEDLARFGEVMRNGGRGTDGGQIVPAEWVADIFGQGDATAWARGTSHYLFPGGRYRSQWYHPAEPADAIVAIGIHGQWLWVDRTNGVTIARLASQPDPIDDSLDLAIIPSLARVSETLSRAGA